MPELLVNIDVDDLERAVAFYRDGLGLEVGRRFGEMGVEMQGAPCPVHLLLKAPGTPAAATIAQPRDYARHWTPVHLDVLVPDIELALSRAEQAGATREGELRIYGWGRIVQLADPFGHGFCLIQLQGRGYDEIAGPST